jgi:hypothetical protein
MERETRFELATLALARRCSTTELLPLGTSLSISGGPNAVKLPNPQYRSHTLWVIQTLNRGPHRCDLGVHCVGNDLAIAHLENAVGDGCGFKVMSNHQHRLTQLLVRTLEH